jgi:putative SOS response-associated peptidase YedK
MCNAFALTPAALTVAPTHPQVAQGRRSSISSRVDGEFLALAGLYDTWKTPEGRELRTCIITAPPRELVVPLYNRMPVILARRAQPQVAHIAAS